MPIDYCLHSVHKFSPGTNKKPFDTDKTSFQNGCSLFYIKRKSGHDDFRAIHKKFRAAWVTTQSRTYAQMQML